MKICNRRQARCNIARRDSPDGLIYSDFIYDLIGNRPNDRLYMPEAEHGSACRLAALLHREDVSLSDHMHSRKEVMPGTVLTGWKGRWAQHGMQVKYRHRQEAMQREG